MLQVITHFFIFFTILSLIDVFIYLTKQFFYDDVTIIKKSNEAFKRLLLATIGMMICYLVEPYNIIEILFN